jgi:hypothetical protein
MTTRFQRASGCKYPKCDHCGADKMLEKERWNHKYCDVPCSRKVEGRRWKVLRGGPKRIEFNLSIGLTAMDIILILVITGTIAGILEYAPH